MVTRATVVAAMIAVILAWAPAWAFNCPVVIKQAEDLVRRAEGKTNQDTRPLVDEAKKYLAEAWTHHEQAKTRRDHGDAVRKAKFAIALAEEVLTLQTP